MASSESFLPHRHGRITKGALVKGGHEKGSTPMIRMSEPLIYRP
jgi:hypothetical protein